MRVEGDAAFPLAGFQVEGADSAAGPVAEELHQAGLLKVTICRSPQHGEHSQLIRCSRLPGFGQCLKQQLQTYSCCKGGVVGGQLRTLLYRIFFKYMADFFNDYWLLISSKCLHLISSMVFLLLI